MKINVVPLLLAVIASVLAWQLGDTPAVKAGLALFVLIGLLWLTEALSLTFTALLVPLLAVALGLADVKTALVSFANPIIFLFLGGFALAAALARHGIDQWLAHRLLSLARGRALPAALMLSVTTALLSMWISNTATAAMMLPLALGLSAPYAKEFPRYRLFLLLALAWSANLGGIATLVGSPPNAIAAAALGWDFSDWLQVGMPAFVMLFPLALLVLFFGIRPEANVPRVMGGSAMPFPASREAWLVLGIFLLTVTLWIAGKPLANLLSISKDFDAWVAVLAIVLLGVTRVVSWQDVEQQASWGVLLLFGGGIALSMIMQSSGTSAWLAAHLSTWMPEEHVWITYLVIAVFVVFLTELVSNTASAALLVPLLMPVAAAVGASPAMTAVLIAVSASCAFMLPVATPPNALVYGTGHVPQKTMVRNGLLMNVVAAVLIGLALPALNNL